MTALTAVAPAVLGLAGPGSGSVLQLPPQMTLEIALAGAGPAPAAPLRQQEEVCVGAA